MRTFRPGDRVVCIEDSGWYRASNWTMLDKLRFMLTGKRPPVSGPAKGEVLRVWARHSRDGELYLHFLKYRDKGGYHHVAFRHLDLLEEQVTRIEEEGVPVEAPAEPETQPA